MMEGGFKNVVFDLDGTLVDSVPGINASLRAAVAFHGLPLEVRDLSRYVGPPLREMILQMWPHLAPGEVDKLVHAFRGHYNTQGCLSAALYPGMLEQLVQLHGSAVQLFVLTNKPLEPTLKILEHLSIKRFFRAVHSPDSPDCPFSVKADGALRLAGAYGLLPEQTLLVGDSSEDREAAEAAGFSFLRAAYGYGHFKAAPASRRWPAFDAPPALSQFLKKETYI
jgi:phosphoglycolate phosphatase